MLSFRQRISLAPLGLAMVVAILSTTRVSVAQESATPAALRPRVPIAQQADLTAEQWRRLDRAVDRGIDFLSKHQQADGSFPTAPDGQPGVTSLCVMAMLARGHQPGKGRYGAQIERAIEYVLDRQIPSGGLLQPGADVAGHYSHGISGVMLTEVFGMTDARLRTRIGVAVNKALQYTRSQQLRPKHDPAERGGWRYLTPSNGNDADLSVTAWQLMFLRAARNAEFNVPEQWVKEAMGYVHRSFDVNERAFVYALSGFRRVTTRGMVGAGVVSLALGGEHGSETARLAGDWILATSFEPYNRDRGGADRDRYHFAAFYCSQAMFQLGGDYWKRFFPGLLKVLADAQHDDGSWDPEATDNDSYGNAYTTAFAILALATPYQMLPVYQR
jgi:prenyltransferase/squalene oxidase-like repeat protein